jgi:PD-(D/E)XK nuclease superfamily
MSAVTIDPPAHLPVDYLSLSSLRLFMQCPSKWRRRYLEHEVEPSSGKMLLGSSAGASLAQHFGTQIESGVGLTTEQVLDEFSTDWEHRIGSEEVDWGKDTAGALKDSGAQALRTYHVAIAPTIEPVAIERGFELGWAGVNWKLTGFIDLESADGLVRDYKMTAKRMSQRDADADLQPTIYLAARRAEGSPAAGFRFDTMIRTAKPTAEVLATERSDEQLDALTGRIFGLTAEIAYRCESGNWSGAAPNTWFCSTCKYGGCALRLGGLS